MEEAPHSAFLGDIVSELGDVEVTADEIVRRFLEHHGPDYDERIAALPAFRVSRASRRAPATWWLEQAAALYREGVLEGPGKGSREAILALALVDLAVGRAMVDSGLFALFAREPWPPL